MGGGGEGAAWPERLALLDNHLLFESARPIETHVRDNQTLG